MCTFTFENEKDLTTHRENDHSDLEIEVAEKKKGAANKEHYAANKEHCNITKTNEDLLFEDVNFCKLYKQDGIHCQGPTPPPPWRFLFQ